MNAYPRIREVSMTMARNTAQFSCTGWFINHFLHFPGVDVREICDFPDCWHYTGKGPYHHLCYLISFDMLHHMHPPLKDNQTQGIHLHLHSNVASSFPDVAKRKWAKEPQKPWKPTLETELFWYCMHWTPPYGHIFRVFPPSPKIVLTPLSSAQVPLCAKFW